MDSIFKSIASYIIENSMIIGIVGGSVAFLFIVSLAIIFHKIKEKAWKAFIPFYNLLVILRVCDIPVWMSLVMFIPFVNFIGIPVMTLIIGWRFGGYCYTNAFVRIGMMVFPPLFYPILSFTDIDIDNPYADGDVVVDMTEDFALDHINLNLLEVAPEVMSLANPETMSKIAVEKKRRISVKLESNQPERKLSTEAVSAGPVAGEIEDLGQNLPTADELTLDYVSIYGTVEDNNKKKTEEEKRKQEEERKKQEEKEREEQLRIEEEEKRKQEEEEIEEEFVPVIHDVNLSSAEPIQDVGPITINKRDEFQHKFKKKEEPVIELDEPKEEEIQIPEFQLSPDLDLNVAPVAGAPGMATLTLTPTITFEPMKEETEEVVNLEPEIVIEEDTETTKIDNVTSLNIAEPGTLPIGILKGKEVKKEEKPVVEVAKVEEIVKREENRFIEKQEPLTVLDAMGFGHLNKDFNSRIIAQDNPREQTISQAPAIFGGGESVIRDTSNTYNAAAYNMPSQPAPNVFGGNNGLLRAGSNPNEQGTVIAPLKNKMCPRCGYMIREDAQSCTVCSYKF